MGIDLTFDADRRLVQEAAGDFFRRRYPPAVVRDLEASEAGWSADDWRAMAELGWLGVTFPDVYGGNGGSFLDLYPVYEEMGRSLVPGPHLDTVAVTGDLLLTVGTDAQRQDFLPAIARGDCIVSLAVAEADGAFGPPGISCSATRRGGDLVVDGTKLLVAFAPSADRLLTAVRTSGDTGPDGVSVLLVDAHADGVTHARLPNIAGLPLYAVTFDGVAVPGAHVVGAVDHGWEALSASVTRAAVLQTATIVGAARAVLDMTNQYAKDRQQFGNPIGRYQAVQYLVSDILIDLHRADLLAKQAAFRIDAGKPFIRESAIAVAFGKRAAAHLHRQAHEVHAGVAFIVEHDLSLYSRRSKYWENNLGDARHYQEMIATAIEL
jgi:alkylation response protein AidB-like acyl-CoA dehydrogenase